MANFTDVFVKYIVSKCFQEFEFPESWRDSLVKGSNTTIL